MDTRCPNCGSTSINFDVNYGFYQCGQCGETWGKPEDDPDYDEFPESCPECWGTGLIYAYINDSQPTKCFCQGTGSI